MKPVIFILINLKFIYFVINFILENTNKAKAKILFIYKNNIFSFIYNLKIIDLGKFSNFSFYNLNNL